MKPAKQKTVASNRDPEISRKTLRELYRVMIRIRKVQLKIAELYSQDQMKTPVHLYIGQEAIAAGICAHLNTDDYVFSNHRGHGHYLAKGGNLNAMIAELYNRATGCSSGRGGSMHLVDTSVGLPGSSSIVAGCVPLATGGALASAIRRDGRVSIAFFGDAASEEGVVYESVNFAMLKKLPVVYVCENNFYSVCSPLEHRQAKDDIYRRFEGSSIPGYRVDGNNVIEVYRIAGEAVARARRGEGPSFLECRTYRLTDHHGPASGVEVGYRTQIEVDDWAARCPVKCFEGFLLEQQLITNADIEKISNRIDGEVEEAFRYAQSSPLPGRDEIMKYLHH